jgi:hypothetical protein
LCPRIHAGAGDAAEDSAFMLTESVGKAAERTVDQNFADSGDAYLSGPPRLKSNLTQNLMVNLNSPPSFFTLASKLVCPYGHVTVAEERSKILYKLWPREEPVEERSIDSDSHWWQASKV